jgi:hypothetical protein
MKPRGSMHVALLLLALLNMIPTVEAEDSWVIFSIAVICALGSWLLSRRRGSPPVPAGIVLLGVVTAIGYLFYEMFGQHDEPTIYIIDLGHFMIFLCCCKFFELRTSRDAGLIVLISFLLLVISGFVSASLLFAIAVVVDVTLGVMWLLAFQSENEALAIALRRARNLGLSPVPVTVTAPATRQGFILSSLVCTVGILAVALISFVAIPRGFGRGFFGRIHRIVPTAVSGFTDEIELRDTAIFEDPTPVMRVQFIQDGEILGGDGFQPYMRGYTLDRYAEGRWQPTHNLTQTRLQMGRALTVMPLPNGESIYPSQSIVEQHVDLQSSLKGTVFSLYPPIFFGSRDVRFVQQDPIDLCLRTSGGGPGFTYLVYSLRGENTADMNRLEAPPRPYVRADAASAITPKVREFAKQFVAKVRGSDKSTDRERICQEFERYLNQGDFEYTLSRGRAPHGVDPLEDFLFTSKRGHCEYFASAMAVLCQAVDIPARIVNGYYAGEYDAREGAYQFRQKDAHSWIEAYIPNKGWLVFDPTPAVSERKIAPLEGFWARAHRMLDVFRFKWSSLVVSFDADRRFDILGRLSRWYTGLFEGHDRPADFGLILKSLLWGPEVLLAWERGLYWLLLVLCLVFAVLFIRLLWVLSMMLRAYLPGRDSPLSIRRAEARFYDRILVLLAHKGFARHSSLTPMEFARALARTHRDLAELPLFTSWFYDAQFGGRSIDRGQSQRLRGFMRRLREDPAYGTR